MSIFNSNGSIAALIILPAFILLIPSCLGFIPQIIEKIEPSIVKDKSTGVLNCTMALLNYQRGRANWYLTKDNKQISRGENLIEPIRLGPNAVPKYEVKFILGRPGYVPAMPGVDVNNLVTYQLAVRFVDINDDNTEYRCVVEIPGMASSNWPTAYGKVIIQREAQIKPTLKPQIITENDPLKMTCEATGSPPPRITWTKANGKPLPLPGSPMRVYNQTLYIPQMSRYDRGVYRCYAQNNVGLSDEFDVMVEVNFAPHVRVARVEGAYGQAPDGNYDATLECIVNGYPDPDLFWYKGVYSPTTKYELIMDGARYKHEKMPSYGAAGMNITDVFLVLLIRNVKFGDYDNYTCLAQNAYGVDKAVVNLFYQTVCQGAVCPMLASLGLGGAAG